MNDLPRQGADVSAPVAADLRLVPHPTQGHAHELAVGGAGDGLTEGGLADAGRAYQAEDGTLELAHPLLHRQVFEDALLDLLQAIVIFLQHLLGGGEVIADAGALLPGDIAQGVDVVAHHRRLRGHGRHQFEFSQLPQGLVLDLLGHAGILDALGQFIGLAWWRLLQVPQFLLDGLHLLVEVILALILLHLLLDAAADPLLRLEDVVLTLHQPHQVLQARLNIGDLQDPLLLVEAQGHVGGHGIRQPRGVIDPRQGGQHLRRDLFVELDILIEEPERRTHQDIRLPLVQGQAFAQGRHRRDEDIQGLGVALDARPTHPLHQDLDGADRQLQQLQHIGQGPDLVQIGGPGLIGFSALLRDEQDLLVAGHGAIQGPDGLVPANEERNDHVRIDDDVPQGQDRHFQGMVRQRILRGVFQGHGRGEALCK